jgi:L-histidine N-alpha-methyltransferase
MSRPRPLVREQPLDPEAQRLADEVRASLTAAEPWLTPKLFYDDHGSRLFEQITQLPEYYATRTEEALLDSVAPLVARETRARELVEIGSGAGRKVRTLLRALRREGALKRLVLLDINELFVRESMRRLGREFPGLELRGVVGDFLHDLPALGPGGGRLLLFLGGTLGNLEPDAARDFLAAVRRQLEPGDAFLLGVQLVTDAVRLHAAYNDAAGVTAAFNLNALRVLNRRLGADFDLAAFEHVAFWNAERGWIEMRLRARRDCYVSVPLAGVELTLRRGDTIRTEISCKYTRAAIESLVAGSGLAVERWLADPDALFAHALLRAA